jgi:acetyl esterase
VLHDAQSAALAKPAVAIRDPTILAGPTGETRIRIIRPEGTKGPLPVIVYFHGAGWVMGDTTTHDRLVRQLARAAVVFVDYKRSPEARYPVPIEQDYAVTKYVAEHPDQFSVDASRLAIAGDSVGGNMTAVVSLLAKERQGLPSSLRCFSIRLLMQPWTTAAIRARVSLAQLGASAW